VYTGADMTSVTNPENGTVTYTYDATHHVTSRTDAKGQQTQYTYDGYGRVTEVQYYPQQGWEDMNQRVNYTYDQGQYGMGRLTGVQFGGNDYWHSMTFSYAYSYNQAGRVITQGMSSGWANLTATYQWDTEGRMTQIGYPGLGFWYSPPGPLYALQYDNMGRLNGMTEDLQNGSGPQPAASAGYGPAGEMVNLSYFGVNETRTYNSLLQLTRMTANLWGANVMDMQYNYSATQNNGRISISNDYVTGENVTYGYDAVNRLTGASAGSMWGEAYSYDGFGNLTGKTVTQSPAPAMGVSYDANNHQLGLSYDANGNQMADAQNATFYWWDVENRLVMSESNGWPGAETWYAYDPWGKRVMKDVNADPYDNGYWGGSWEFYFYGITGQKLATASCSYPSNCTLSYNVYFGGKLVKSNSGPVVTDRLGSVRYSAGVSRSYFPYGEERTVTSDDTEKFGTYLRDGPGQDYAEQRYYNNGTGRFWSVDPGGMKTANPGNPISLNRYAYVNGDLVNFRDRHGLIVEAPGAVDCIADPDYCTAYDWNSSFGCNPGLGLVAQPGCDAGGSGSGDGGDPGPDCNAITSAVGFAGLTYANASEIWSDGGLSGYKDDGTAAIIATLSAVTWQGESSFSLSPINNPNKNDQGVITSVDYGPLQINQHFHPNSNGAIWGTSGAGETFNGNADANITFGIGILEGLYTHFGNNAAGRYVGSLASISTLPR
jgi:RHS repeat-associated protein